MKKEIIVDIYTDGACSCNPGKGGWAAILIHNGTEKTISGFVDNTTNNQMELLAVINGLDALKVYPCKVNLYSDSAYVINAFTQGWIEKWKKNGWVTSTKKPIQNRDLWEQLDYLTTMHTVSFNKIRGHSDNKYNNLCDQIARQEILKNK